MGLTSAEAASLLEALGILEQIPPGIIRNGSADSRNGLQRLSRHGLWDSGLTKRIEIRLPHQRKLLPKVFATVLDAIRQEIRVECTYRSIRSDGRNTREISPIRLVHYRSNWYLAGWCHNTDSFCIASLDGFSNAQKLRAAVHKPPERLVEQAFDSSYGIYIGEARARAILVFEAQAARWVADEQWHRDATCEHCPDGRVRLSVPYNVETEILMEILRYGPDCVVESPESLRRRVAHAHHQAAQRYFND